jgi:hypothetical protein
MAQAKKDQKSKQDQDPEQGSKVSDVGAGMVARFEAELAAAHEQEARRRKIPREALAKGRTTPIAVRFDEFTLKRLRVLAARRNTGYQTLLKEFVVERLYEEEKREGLVE